MPSKNPAFTEPQNQQGIAMRSEDGIAKTIRGIGVLLCIASMLGSLALLSTQIYAYLKTGEWVPSGVLDTVGPLLHWEWAVMPMDWLGLHGMLNAINSGAALFCVGVCVGLLLSNFEST